MSLEDDINEYLKQYAVVKEIKEKLDEQGKEIGRLHTIIKEAKEYVYKMFNIEPANSREYDYHCGKLAEILDKEKQCTNCGQENEQ